MRQLLASTVLVAAFSGSLLADPASVNSSAFRTVTVDPFTHQARIPQNADLQSIKFEKASKVSLLTKMSYAEDTEYCGSLAFRDPGGSIECPHASVESRVEAYELTYSFTAPAMVSDEFENTHFTFHVYLRPEELSSELRDLLNDGKASRAKVGERFGVRTSQEQIQTVAINEAQTRMCDGTLVDGSWVRRDANCADQINYKTVTVPSDFVVVTVGPSVPREVAAQ